MARGNVYIRKENEEMWDNLKDKSGFVNDALWQSKFGKLKDLGETVEFVEADARSFTTPKVDGEPYYDARLGRMVTP